MCGIALLAFSLEQEKQEVRRNEAVSVKRKRWSGSVGDNADRVLSMPMPEDIRYRWFKIQDASGIERSKQAHARPHAPNLFGA
jgi:hypothetical protein